MNETTARPSAASPGALVILTCSAIAMSLPGAVLAGPPGLLATVLIALATLWCWTRTRPTPPPTRLGRRGAAWVQATAIAEGVVTTTGFIPLMMTGHIRWWLPLVLCSVSIHLTTFLVWARRRADLLLVPVSWAAVGLSAALTAQGQWRAGWVEGGWVMAVAVLGYVLVLATPAGNVLCGPVRMGRARTMVRGSRTSE